jgi:lysophospholipase L1-like esterase
MKKILISFLLLANVNLFAQVDPTIADAYTAINANILNNVTKLITPSKLRKVDSAIMEAVKSLSFKVSDYENYNLSNFLPYVRRTSGSYVSNTTPDKVFLQSNIDAGEGAGMYNPSTSFLSYVSNYKQSAQFKVTNGAGTAFNFGIGNDDLQQGYNRTAVTKFSITGTFGSAVSMRIRSGFPSGFINNVANNSGGSATFLVRNVSTNFIVNAGDSIVLTTELTKDSLYFGLSNLTTKLSFKYSMVHPYMFTEYDPYFFGSPVIYFSQGEVLVNNFNIKVLNLNTADYIFIGNSITMYPGLGRGNVVDNLINKTSKKIINLSLSALISKDVTVNSFPKDLYSIKNKTVFLNGMILVEFFNGQSATALQEYNNLVKILKANNNTIVHITGINTAYHNSSIINLNNAILKTYNGIDQVYDLYQGWVVNTLWMPDQLHPNELGASMMAERIATAFPNYFEKNIKKVKAIVDAPYTITSNDDYIELSGFNTGQSYAIDLPDPTVNKGKIITINNLNIGTFTYPIFYFAVNYPFSNFASQIIKDGQKVTVFSNGTDWHFINEYNEFNFFDVRGFNPSSLNLKNNSYKLWKNTNTGELRIWANDNGTIKSVLLN